jgi:hypothetical protein
MPMTGRESGSGGGTLRGFQRSFFDRDAVMKEADKFVRKRLNWFGGYTRTVARNSIKEDKSVAAPGQPPHAHRAYTRTRFGRSRKAAKPRRSLLFRDTVLYSYDFKAQTVIIGPFRFSDAQGDAVPGLLEHGGATVRVGPRHARTLTYRVHPFMRPAFLKAVEKFKTKGE